MRPPTKHPARTVPLRTAAILLSAPLLGACGDSVSGPQGQGCGPGPYFNVLPVEANDIEAVSVFGGLGAPGHTLPTPHGGIFMARASVPFRSPGDLAVTELRRVRYLQSPTRQGVEDYAIFFQVCSELSGWFGHVAALAPVFSPASIDWDDCQTYSTSDETVQACEDSGLDIKVRAGESLGAASALEGYRVIDFGMIDDRVDNFYISRGRHPRDRFHAVCMWEQFDPGNREIFFSKLRDLARPHVPPAGEPRCGTMEVDVPNTAKGVWAETGVSGMAGGDETRYITLANYPYRPQDELVLSLGPSRLGAITAIVPRLTTGRVNRAFEQVTSTGLIHCYGPGFASTGPASWFLALQSGTSLRIEKRDHAPGASPCNADPASWSFGAGAMTMVR